MRKLINHIATKEYFFLYFGGLFILLISTLLEPAEGSGTSGFWLRKATQLFDAAGFSIIITTLVASVLNFRFQDAIADRFSIVGGAEGAQIRRLFPSRFAALSSMKEESERVAEQIDILCVSGTDLLGPDKDVLRVIGKRCQSKNNIHVRVLLLDPRSRYAVERALREEGERVAEKLTYDEFDLPDKKLCHDTSISLLQLESILELADSDKNTNFKLEVRLYNSAPMTYYVRIDRSVFVEQYHLGIPRGDVNSAATKCLGKVIPTIETRADSDLGFVLDSHFDYLWKRSLKSEIRRGSSKILWNSVRNTDWVKKHMESIKAEEDELALSPPADNVPDQGR